MPAPRWDIYEEHLDEAGFLWTQWERARLSPRYTLAELAGGLEERLWAHLDGLVLGAKPVADKLLLPLLGDDSADGEKVFAAAWALLEGGGLDAVLEALEKGPPELRPSLTRALELCRHADVEQRVTPYLTGGEPALALTALRVLGARGVDPGGPLLALMGSEDAEVAEAALALAALGADLHRKRALQEAFTSSIPAVQDAALQAGLLLGMRAAWQACLSAVKAGSTGLALQVVAMGGREAEVLALLPALEREETRKAALWALGFSGRAAVVEACLPYLSDKKAGPVAGEALSAITGVVLEGALLAEPPPEPEEPVPFEEEDLDAELADGPEAELPQPEGEAVRAWWEKNRDRFKGPVRYAGGAPLSRELLMAAVREGPLRRRPALALEAALRGAPAKLTRTRGWARDQVSGLRGVGTPREDVDRGFEELLRG